MMLSSLRLEGYKEGTASGGLIGLAKSLVRLSVRSHGKTQMNFLANPMFQTPVLEGNSKGLVNY